MPPVVSHAAVHRPIVESIPRPLRLDRKSNAYTFFNAGSDTATHGTAPRVAAFT